MDKLSTSTTNLKTRKELLILNYLQRYGQRSRIELSTKLHLTKSAITEITNGMIKSGVILEKGDQFLNSDTHPRGRRKILLDINYNYKLVFGVVVEKDEITVGLTNLIGQVLDKRKKSIKDKNYRELLELIVSNINAIMKNNCMTNENILALGVCISKNVGDLIDGVKEIDKLTRLKKDLSYAMSIKITTDSTISGSLVAQKLFAEETCRGILMLRYGKVVESGIMIDGKNYKGFTGNAGGFLSLMSDATVDEQEKSLLNERLAKAIITCNKVIDAEKIYCFGDHFEDEIELQKVKDYIAQNGQKKLQLYKSIVTEDTLFLAPCAEAINSYFYLNNDA